MYKVKKKFVHGQGCKTKMLVIEFFFPLDYAIWCNIVISKLLVKKFIPYKLSWWILYSSIKRIYNIRDHNIESNLNENHEVVRKDQFLQKVEPLRLENYTFQEIDDEIKEKKIELI